jgi:hypothetical protein
MGVGPPYQGGQYAYYQVKECDYRQCGIVAYSTSKMLVHVRVQKWLLVVMYFERLHISRYRGYNFNLRHFM